jgi:hypothetical protein
VEHIKPLNWKGKRLQKIIDVKKEPEVEGLSLLPMGCATLFDPGWETDFSGMVLDGLCQPHYRDIYGCYGDCWWAAQVPDGLTNYGSYSDECPVAANDWRKLNYVKP